jgi:hypothetical protein
MERRWLGVISLPGGVFEVGDSFHNIELFTTFVLFFLINLNVREYPKRRLRHISIHDKEKLSRLHKKRMRHPVTHPYVYLDLLIYGA